MRRTLAVTLALSLLLVGGCTRQHATPPATQPAVVSPTTPAGGTPAAGTTSDPAGVDDLLNQVDKQLSSDDQPAADQD